MRIALSDVELRYTAPRSTWGTYNKHVCNDLAEAFVERSSWYSSLYVKIRQYGRSHVSTKESKRTSPPHAGRFVKELLWNQVRILRGEISLRGRVLPVGGIKGKLFAASRAGIETVVMPKRNEKDLRDVPEEVRDALDIHLVDTIEEALAVTFSQESPTAG